MQSKGVQVDSQDHGAILESRLWFNVLRSQALRMIKPFGS